MTWKNFGQTLFLRKRKVSVKMKFKLICIGKLPANSPISLIFNNYAKRIMNRLEVIEIFDKSPVISKRLENEKKKIISLLRLCDVVIILDQIGEKINSTNFSNFIKGKMIEGTKDITFVIGGANGLHKDLISKQKVFSFGNLTWPHQLMRILLIEQIYRAMSIINGHPYDK